MTEPSRGEWRAEARVELRPGGPTFDETRREAALAEWLKVARAPARVSRSASVHHDADGVVFDGVFATLPTPGGVVEQAIDGIRSALARAGLDGTEGSPHEIHLTALPERPGTQPGHADG